MFFVVYRHKEVIDGPYPLDRAQNISEDLSLLFEDTNYTVLHQEEVQHLGLKLRCCHHIHEDMPLF